MVGADHPAFAGIDDTLRERIRREGRIVHLPEGQKVFRPGDACQGLPLVIEGSVRVQMTSDSGHEIVLYRIGSAEVCTLSIGCLMAGRGYRAEAVVESPTMVMLLPHGLFDDLMGASRAFRRQIMASYGERLETLMLLVEEVAFRRMDERLADWLRERADQSPLHITHQTLAVELGTAREVVSRLLKEFERRGWVRLFRGRIDIVDLPPDPTGTSGRAILG
ncbi:Crp/Fnr family transcriptional regulator [Halomonas campisalis]|uniref:Crp/Fnr family transcriptional regulator n=1 Tax=Billgrantia campisalis TaxID=74661 RepID=A0ABS9P4E4_9GAMM|nr:Crp/Fnr family transcriptional regulator [Halomonas campisalis]MCG6656619.1 Crp/Fnr family transcriptional regulator [Halomonas campisalis]MDR5861807.1 Crp/Fnr family transcriptional regulator [Halomonas campisalis]